MIAAFCLPCHDAVLYAELFNWVLRPRQITVDQAMRCAKREPGRSWEAIETELNKLGMARSCQEQTLCDWLFH